MTGCYFLMCDLNAGFLSHDQPGSPLCGERLTNLNRWLALSDQADPGARRRRATALDVTLPGMRQPNDGGPFYTVCGRCLSTSTFLANVDAETASAALMEAGWTSHEARPGAQPYALCPACTATPFSLDAAVKRAHKSRKRK